jgi:hypothetical protein
MRIPPPLDGEGWGGVESMEGGVLSESPPPPKPSPIEGEGFS